MDTLMYICTHMYSHVTHTHTHAHILHTCYSCKWYFLSFLMCAFPQLSSAGERPVAAESFCPFETGGSGANFYRGRRRVIQGWKSFGQAKYSAGYVEAAKQLIIRAKH